MMKKTIRSITGTAVLAVAAGVLGVAAGQALAGPQHVERSHANAPQHQAVNPWSQLSYEGAYEVENYEALRGTVRSATVSVLGTVTSVRPGEVIVDSDGDEEMRYQSVIGSVDVDDVLSGAVADGTESVSVEFGPFAEEDLDSTNFTDLIGQQSIYFLRLKGSGVDSEGIAPDSEVLERNVYRVINSTGLLDNAGGVVEAPLAEGDGFVADLEGEPFDQTVTKIDAQG